MENILKQLGINQTVFVQFGLFIVLYVFLSRVYFKPFLELIIERRKRTTDDREAAFNLMKQADEKFTEYTAKLQNERLKARAEYEKIILDAKIEESKILIKAREEAKQITQATLENMASQQQQIMKQLSNDVEGLSRQIAAQLLGAKQ